MITLVKSYKANVSNRHNTSGIVKVLIILVFVAGAGIINVFDSISYVTVQPDRLYRNFKEDEGLNAEIVNTKSTFFTRVLYSLAGFVTSIPFILAWLKRKSGKSVESSQTNTKIQIRTKEIPTITDDNMV